MKPSVKNPSDKVLKAIINLEHDKDWEIIVGWLRDAYTDTACEAHNTLDDKVSHWLQGHAQLLEMLLKTIKNASKKLDELKKTHMINTGSIA